MQAVALGASSSAIGAVLAACTSGSATSGTKKTQLVVAKPASPPSLDPQVSGEEISDPLLNMHSGLIRSRRIPAAESGGWDVQWSAQDFTQAVEPVLAQSWDVSSDGRVYTFHLQQGRMSHTGHELTADDVKWTSDRRFALGALGAFYNSVMKIAKADDVQALGRYTVQVTLQTPTPDFLLVMASTAHLQILDSTEAKAHATASDPWATNWMKSNSVGFGPYKLESFIPGTQLTMVAFDQYKPSPPPLKRLVFRVVPDAASRTALLAHGDVDAATILTPQQYRTLKATSGVRVWSFPGQDMTAVLPSWSFPPMNIKAVRQALSYAVDYDAIVNDVFAGFATHASGPMTSNEPDSDRSNFPYQVDVNKAKELLAGAGLGSGFSTTYSYDQTDGLGELIGVQLKSDFAKIGVQLALQGTSSSQASDILFNGKAPLAFFNLGADTPDPQYVNQLFFYSKSSTDWNHFVDPKVDQLIDKSSGISDWAQRVAANGDTVKAVIDDAAWIWLAQPGFHIASRSNVTGLNFYNSDSIRYDLVDFV